MFVHDYSVKKIRDKQNQLDFEAFTERLIHNDYLQRLDLTMEEACNLFDAIHYYGKHNTLETAEQMMISEAPLPLVNHWSSFDEFLTIWDFFHKITRESHRTAFGKMVIYHQFPAHLTFSKEQEELLRDPEDLKRQACFLLSFFDSLSDYFEYEVTMIERGYPHRRRAA